MIRFAVLSPIKTSLYSRLVVHLAALEPEVELTDVIVRTPWTYRRIRGELRRDGARLLWKAYHKIVLKEKAYDEDDEENIRSLARRVELPGRTLMDLAAIHGFRVVVVKDHNDPRAQQALCNCKPDVIAFTGGGLIRREVLQASRLGILNCHLGMLPRYRGMDVVEWPVLERDQDDQPLQVGLTVHFMDRGLDTGPILLRRPMDIRPHDTFCSIRTRMGPAMVEMMMEAIRNLRDGTAKIMPQSIEQGRQYFVMHPRMQTCAERRLQRYLAAAHDLR